LADAFSGLGWKAPTLQLLSKLLLVPMYALNPQQRSETQTAALSLLKHDFYSIQSELYYAFTDTVDRKIPQRETVWLEQTMMLV
jgi:hypothetical protein